MGRSLNIQPPYEVRKAIQSDSQEFSSTEQEEYENRNWQDKKESTEKTTDERGCGETVQTTGCSKSE